MARECPICKQQMYPKQVKGIEVDICDDHGVFLDKGELEKLASEFKKDGFAEGFTSSLKTLWRSDV